MLIGIDGNEANVKEKVGVSVYTLKLLNYFKKIANQCYQFLIFIKHKPNQDLPKPSNYFHYQIVPGDFLWSQTLLPLELYKKNILGQRIDVFFSPAHYAPRFCPIPTVVTIHDLSYFYYPEEFLKKDLYQLKNWTKYSVEKAKKIIAVSNTTKKDLIKFYNIPENKIVVVYNGYEKLDKDLEKENFKLLKKLKISKKKYFLYVGTIQPRKNLITLIYAFNLFRTQNEDFALVVAGKKGWLYENIFYQVKKLKLEKNVKFLGYISDEELTVLYKNAFCFVLPSFYEGFGIPILEAMSFGCPVISSNASSLPEIGGNACLYFNPNDSKELAEKFFLLKQNHSLAKQLIQNGKKRIKKFSWQTCAQQTLEILLTKNGDKNNFSRF